MQVEVQREPPPVINFPSKRSGAEKVTIRECASIGNRKTELCPSGSSSSWV